jgi:hypothetical protein
MNVFGDDNFWSNMRWRRDGPETGRPCGLMGKAASGLGVLSSVLVPIIAKVSRAENKVYSVLLSAFAGIVITCARGQTHCPGSGNGEATGE